MEHDNPEFDIGLTKLSGQASNYQRKIFPWESLDVIK
jgi:hypothetical protein